MADVISGTSRKGCQAGVVFTRWSETIAHGKGISTRQLTSLQPAARRCRRGSHEGPATRSLSAFRVQLRVFASLVYCA